MDLGGVVVVGGAVVVVGANVVVAGGNVVVVTIGGGSVVVVAGGVHGNVVDVVTAGGTHGAGEGAAGGTDGAGGPDGAGGNATGGVVVGLIGTGWALFFVVFKSMYTAASNNQTISVNAITRFRVQRIKFRKY